MLVKWKLAIQLFWYRLLILLGFKGEEIYYIGGSEALAPALDPGRRGDICWEAAQRRRRRSGNADRTQSCGWLSTLPASLKIPASTLKIWFPSAPSA